MPLISIVDAAGAEHVVQATPGLSVMRVIRDNGLDDVIGLCGGNCACGTCRIYVPGEWRGCFDDPRASEQEMIEFAQDPTEGVRLACQTKVSEAMEGMVLNLPESQHY